MNYPLAEPYANINLAQHSKAPDALWDEYQCAAWMIKQTKKHGQMSAYSGAMGQMSNVHLGAFPDVEMTPYPDTRALPPVSDDPPQWAAQDVKALYNACLGWWTVVLSLQGTPIWNHPELLAQAQKSFRKKADRVIGNQPNSNRRALDS